MASLETIKTMIMTMKSSLETSYDISHLIIFGSYAKNNANTLSDLDIAIFTQRELGLLEFGMLVSDLEQVTNLRVDLVVLNELYKTNAKLAFSILQNHELVFSNDREKYIDFKSNTMQYYFDIEPMYKMFDRELKQRLDNGTYGQV